MLNKYTLLFVLLSSSIFYACDNARVHDKKEWKQLFDSYQITDACIIIKDQTHEIVDYYNLNRCRKRFTPASTFKIMNSLIALETNTIPDESYTIQWDGVKRRPDWDTTMDMRKAFEVSNLIYYQQIAKKIGKEKLQLYIDTCQYGNKKTGNTVDSFWIDGTLTISADEQLGFIKKLFAT
jgi:beta-lactamase class D